MSFAFNLGSINQLTANGKRSIQEISAKILAYNKAGGKALAGLTRRRKAEKVLFDKPIVGAVVLSEEREDCVMPTIKRGCKGAPVRVWQVMLRMSKDQIDGVFGPYTEQRTIEFQAENGLAKDGIVGKDTWQKGIEQLWAMV